LHADYESDLVFWVDVKQHVVVSSDFNGQNRSILLMSPHFLRHAVAITVFEVISAGCYWAKFSCLLFYSNIVFWTVRSSKLNQKLNWTEVTDLVASLLDSSVLSF